MICLYIYICYVIIHLYKDLFPKRFVKTINKTRILGCLTHVCIQIQSIFTDSLIQSVIIFFLDQTITTEQLLCGLYFNALSPRLYNPIMEILQKHCGKCERKWKYYNRRDNCNSRIFVKHKR